jgi:hypothetical protein
MAGISDASALAITQDLLKTDGLTQKHREWVIMCIAARSYREERVKGQLLQLAAAYSSKGWRLPAYDEERKRMAAIEQRKWAAVISVPTPPSHIPGQQQVVEKTTASVPPTVSSPAMSAGLQRTAAVSGWSSAASCLVM